MIIFRQYVFLKHGKRAVMLFSLVLGSLFIGCSGIADANDNLIQLETAVRQAQQNDPWLVGNRHSQNSVEAMSVAAGTLPDPKMTVGLLNMPTDTFDFSQEPMTQFAVGVSQMFPRGESLAIRKKQLEIDGSKFPYQRLDRQAQIAVIVSQLWLDAYNAQESIALIQKDRPLFEQLADIAEASYSAAFGKTRQQDIIRAQLELTRLDDRLTMLRQKQEMFMEKLSEWVSDYYYEEYGERSSSAPAQSWSSLQLARELPDVKMLREPLYLSHKNVGPQEFFEYVSKHPSLLALDREIEASEMGIDLARQKYKPEWAVNGAYGYRNEDKNGNDLPDFVSLGVSFDLPFFTENRQDKE
ncbi:MAG: TolC family protein, partial [Desulforhopalus sp.]